MSKLNLNEATIAEARALAKAIAEDTQSFVERHTTVTVERTICRLLGIDGVNEDQVPLPNVVVDHLKEKNGLATGISFYLANAIIQTGKTPQEIAEAIDKGEMDLTTLPVASYEEIRKTINPLAEAAVAKIKENRSVREDYLQRFGDKEGPYLYLIVATGNIYEDITQAKAAARQGADVIAVIRTTGQSLLDYVPHGATTEGFGGTVATQETSV